MNFWGAGFFILAFSCSIKNVVLLALVLVGAWFINARFTSALIEMDPKRIPEECFSGLVLFVVVLCSVEGVVLVLVAVEKVLSHTNSSLAARKEHGSTTEKQPLVVI